jgi:K+:H+ antiporter
MSTSKSTVGATASYIILVGGALLGIVWVLRVGSSLSAPHASGNVAVSLIAASGIFRLDVFLAQVAIVVLISRLLGDLLRHIGQPRVVGEMLGGILLGPSVFGWIAPAAYSAVFPIGSVRFLNAVSQLGVLLFMFLVGLELNPEMLRGRRRVLVITSHAGIAIPLFFGALLALVLYPRLANDTVSFEAFALFIGCALSVTAFPVLARLLAERRLTNTPFGTLAIGCAAIADVTAWCVLAVVLAVADASRSGPRPWLSIALALVFVVFMMTLGRRFVSALVMRTGDARPGLTRELLSVVVVVALTSAWVTERLGIHALLGAFIAGLAMPKSETLVSSIATRLEELLTVVLLPLFFAVTGIRTSFSSIPDGATWLLCALVVLVAIAGKAGGTIAGARASGLSWRDSAALGALMNTRGLMELVILNVGLEIGIISRSLFSMMVLMAIVTTALTAPALSWLRAGERRSALASKIALESAT